METGENRPEVSAEAQVFALKNEIARLAETTPDQITLHNGDRYLSKEARFLYGFTPEGFVKMAASEKVDEKKQLANEANRTQIANKLAIPSVKVLTPYRETEDGQGFVQLEKLEATSEDILTSPEAIAAASPEYGRKVGERLLPEIGKPIPEDIDTSELNHEHWKNKKESFWGKWHASSGVVLDEEHTRVRDQYIHKEYLETALQEFEAVFAPILESAETPDQEYFVHNDLAPNNLYLDTGGEDMRILDFEHAGVTNNFPLAQLTELSNFYGRCWPNPEMQQEFLASCLEQADEETLDYYYHMLKGVAIFGVTGLAKFAMKEDHPEHTMAVSLLSNLESNISKLDELYAAQKEKFGSPEHAEAA